MPTESSRTPQKTEADDRVSLHVRLVAESEAGHLDELQCPKCRHPAVSVWFSHPDKDVYRTWFICGDCDFHTRVQNLERPPYFSEDRVSTDLHERDLLILKQAIFKRPPHKIM